MKNLNKAPNMPNMLDSHLKGYFGPNSRRNGPHDEVFFNCLMLYLDNVIAQKKKIQDGEEVDDEDNQDGEDECLD